jgi:very-short-patch-repair endonuclease
MREKGARPDQKVAEIAGRQHGIVAASQLIAAGLSTSAISRRVTSGRLHRVHRGVYAVGHISSSLQQAWMAAVLAYGRCAGGGGEHESRSWGVGEAAEDPAAAVAAGEAITILDYWGAALSHRSAAQLWELLPARDGPIDVSVPGTGGKKRRKGVRLHRSLTLLPVAVTLRSGIPVSTPARTIADLRRSVAAPGKRGLIPPKELRRAIRQADVLGLPLGDDEKRDRTRSDLERDFLRLCRRHRLFAPEVNVRIGPHLVDFLWRDRRLVVETDGYASHRGRAAFQDDRGRDLDLRARGFEVIRLAEKQLDDEPRRVAEVVCAALRVGPDGHGSENRGESGE